MLRYAVIFAVMFAIIMLFTAVYYKVQLELERRNMNGMLLQRAENYLKTAVMLSPADMNKTWDVQKFSPPHAFYYAEISSLLEAANALLSLYYSRTDSPVQASLVIELLDSYAKDVLNKIAVHQNGHPSSMHDEDEMALIRRDLASVLDLINNGFTSEEQFNDDLAALIGKLQCEKIAKSYQSRMKAVLDLR